MKGRGEGCRDFPVKSQQVSFGTEYCSCVHGKAEVCPQRRAGYKGDEVFNGILVCKTGRQERICDKIKVWLSSNAAPFPISLRDGGSFSEGKDLI